MSAPVLLPQSIFRFDDRETFIYPGDILIGNVQSYQFLSTMPAQFSVEENVSGTRFNKGSAIARGPADVGFILADNSILPNQAVGLACEFSEAGRGAIVQLFGPFCLFDWTAIAGAAQLTPRTTYYLSATPGMITSILPAGPAIAQRVGYSLSPNVLNIGLDMVDSGGSSGSGGGLAAAWFFSNCC